MRLLIALAIAIFLYYLQDRYFRKHWNQQLNTTVSFDQSVVRTGDIVTIKEVISNEKKLPLPILYLKYKVPRSFEFQDIESDTSSDYIYRNDIFTLSGEERLTRQLKFSPQRRGHYVLRDLQLISKSLFLTNTLADTFKNQAEIYVLPKLLEDATIPVRLHAALENPTLQRNQPEDPFSFRGIRDYQPYDRPNQINWKATAKMDRPMVNLYHSSTAHEVRIFLNITPHYKVRSEDLLEYSIRLTATLIHSYFEKHQPVSLIINSESDRKEEAIAISFGSDLSHYISLQKALATIKGPSDTFSFSDLLHNHLENGDKNYTNIIISTYRGEDLSTLYHSALKRGEEIVWICPEFSSIHIKEAIPGLYKWEVDEYAKIN